MPQRDTAFLEHGADPDRELPLAATTTPQEAFVALPGLGVPHLINVGVTASRASRQAVPPHLLHELDRSRLISTGPWYCLDDGRLVGRDLGVLTFVSHDVIIIPYASVASSIYFRSNITTSAPQTGYKK